MAGSEATASRSAVSPAYAAVTRQLDVVAQLAQQPGELLRARGERGLQLGVARRDDAEGGREHRAGARHLREHVRRAP